MITLLTILGWMAWTGGILLFFQIMLMIFGFDSTDTDVDFDVSTDTDVDVDTDSQSSGVKLFSILGLSAFLLMFGLAGRYCLITLTLHWSISLLIAVAFGLGMMYFVAWLFYKAKSLESNGTTLIKDAVNCTGTVYLPFEGDNAGVVQVDVNGIMREYNAKAFSRDKFEVGDSVKVSSVQGNFLKVIKNNN